MNEDSRITKDDECAQNLEESPSNLFTHIELREFQADTHLPHESSVQREVLHVEDIEDDPDNYTLLIGDSELCTFCKDEPRVKPSTDHYLYKETPVVSSCPRRIPEHVNTNDVHTEPGLSVSYDRDSCSWRETRVLGSCLNHFSKLPEEIVLRIFSFLTQRELCRFVAPVCVRWLQFSRDPSLWDRIAYEEFKDVSDDLFVKVLTSWCPLLKQVDFKCRSNLNNDDFELVFRSCPLVEEISFAFCTQITDDTLRLMSRNCKFVHKLNFEGTSIHDISLWTLIGLPLNYVNVSHCTHLTDDGLIFLSKNFQGLIGINFDGVQWITNDSLQVLMNCHSDKLLYIILDGADLTDESVQLLAQAKCTRTFSLSFCDTLTDSSLQWIKKFQSLQSLQLKKGLNFSNEGILDLLNDFRVGRTLSTHGLTYLNLAECSSLSDECLLCIADGCPNLWYLSLSWCWEVTDDGIDFIMDKCHQLLELYLCGLHELYGAPFARVPQETKQLRYLDLRQCNKVSDDLLADLVQLMPTLTILNYYGEVVQAGLHFWSLDTKCTLRSQFRSLDTSLM